MTFELEVESLDSLEQEVLQWFESVRIPAQAAMADKLAWIVDQNFDGPYDRPSDWQDLSFEYSKVVERPEATLILTSGESTRVNDYYGKHTVPGLLRSSTRVEVDNPEYASVINDCPYAAIHQWGGENEEGHELPARPFFPLIGTAEHATLTPNSELEIRLAAEQAIAEHVRSI